MTIKNHSRLQILLEDDSIIVCKKPAGTATQSSNIRTPDMLSLIKSYLAKSTLQKRAPYLAVIHRLDQPVEGILVFAKTPAAAKELSNQLTNGQFTKKYRALISADSIPKKDSDILTDYLRKSNNNNLSEVCAASADDAKLSRLSYKILKDSEQRYYTSQEDIEQVELDILLDTGRHHQIRLQLSHMGSPILGDHKYGTSISSEYSRQLKLCAYELSFRHPDTKKELTFSLLD